MCEQPSATNSRKRDILQTLIHDCTMSMLTIFLHCKNTGRLSRLRDS